MKRKSIFVALVLTLALCFGSIQSVFAETWTNLPTEVQVETVTYNFHNQVVDGNYKLVNTEDLRSWVDADKAMIILDTMYAEPKIDTPKSFSNICPLTWDEFKDDVDAQKVLKKAVEDKLVEQGLVYTKNTYTKYKKVTKAAYKKVSDKNLKKYSKGKYYKRSYVQRKGAPDKKATIVVYCGHIGCGRSHVGAKYLRSLGYTNVYRYGGGYSAWVTE